MQRISRLAPYILGGFHHHHHHGCRNIGLDAEDSSEISYDGYQETFRCQRFVREGSHSDRRGMWRCDEAVFERYRQAVQWSDGLPMFSEIVIKKDGSLPCFGEEYFYHTIRLYFFSQLLAHPLHLPIVELQRLLS